MMCSALKLAAFVDIETAKAYFDTRKGLPIRSIQKCPHCDGFHAIREEKAAAPTPQEQIGLL